VSIRGLRRKSSACIRLRAPEMLVLIICYPPAACVSQPSLPAQPLMGRCVTTATFEDAQKDSSLDVYRGLVWTGKHTYGYTDVRCGSQRLNNHGCAPRQQREHMDGSRACHSQ
jgi:hypothetical protein